MNITNKQTIKILEKMRKNRRAICKENVETYSWLFIPVDNPIRRRLINFVGWR